MNLDIFILAHMDQNRAMRLKKIAEGRLAGAKIFVARSDMEPKGIYDGIITTSSNENVMIIDEFCEFGENLPKFINENLGKHSFSFELSVSEDLFLKRAFMLKKSDLKMMTPLELMSVLWGKDEVIKKYKILNVEKAGDYFKFLDCYNSYFFGSKIKRKLEKYGDKEDIKDLEMVIPNPFFKNAPYDRDYLPSKQDPNVKALVAKHLNLPETNWDQNKYLPSGRGVIFVPVRDMEECYGIRKFAASIYGQTYLDFEIICFGKAEDLKDFSNYLLDSVKFKITNKTDFDFINDVVQENKHDWYFVANHNSEYDRRTLEICLSQGKDIVGFGVQPADIQNGNILGNGAIDSKSIFFKRKALLSIGYFDPVNKFGALEMFNRCLGSKFENFSLISVILATQNQLKLDIAIDKEEKVRNKYLKAMKINYSVGSHFNGKRHLFKVPLELSTNVFPKEKGNLKLNTMFIRTLENNERLASVLSQVQEFEIKNVSLWKNTLAGDEKIEKAIKDGLVKRGPECYQCGELKCDHSKRVITDGQLANFFSMMDLFKYISSNDYGEEELFLICEDDVVFKNNFVKIVNLMIEKDEVKNNLSSPLLIRVGWGDMLDYRKDHYYENDEDYSLEENMKRFSNPCFIVNKHAVNHYLKEFKQYDRACDQWIHMDEGMNIKNYCIYPPLCNELSHVGKIVSDMHPKSSRHEFEMLKFMKTGNIEHYNRSLEWKKEYDDYWEKFEKSSEKT